MMTLPVPISVSEEHSHRSITQPEINEEDDEKHEDENFNDPKSSNMAEEDGVPKYSTLKRDKEMFPVDERKENKNLFRVILPDDNDSNEFIHPVQEATISGNNRSTSNQLIAENSLTNSHRNRYYRSPLLNRENIDDSAGTSTVRDEMVSSLNLVEPANPVHVIKQNGKTISPIKEGTSLKMEKNSEETVIHQTQQARELRELMQNLQASETNMEGLSNNATTSKSLKVVPRDQKGDLAEYVDQISSKTSKKKLQKMMNGEREGFFNENPQASETKLQQTGVKKKILKKPLITRKDQSSYSPVGKFKKKPEDHVPFLAGLRTVASSSDTPVLAPPRLPDKIDQNQDTGQIAHAQENVTSFTAPEVHQPTEKLQHDKEPDDHQLNLLNDQTTAEPSGSHRAVSEDELSHENNDNADQGTVNPLTNLGTHQNVTPSMNSGESLLQRVRRKQRKEERFFDHPEGCYTGRTLRECWHCEEVINSYGLRLCENCGRPWCETCRRWCEEPPQEFTVHKDDQGNKKAS